MKTVTKTFYVCKDHLDSYDYIGATIYKSDTQNFEVQISWQEPEKKIEITENDFDEAFRDAFKLRGYSKDFFVELKKRLFNQ